MKIVNSNPLPKSPFTTESVAMQRKSKGLKGLIVTILGRVFNDWFKDIDAKDAKQFLANMKTQNAIVRADVAKWLYDNATTKEKEILKLKKDSNGKLVYKEINSDLSHVFSQLRDTHKVLTYSKVATGTYLITDPKGFFEAFGVDFSKILK